MYVYFTLDISNNIGFLSKININNFYIVYLICQVFSNEPFWFMNCMVLILVGKSEIDAHL